MSFTVIDLSIVDFLKFNVNVYFKNEIYKEKKSKRQRNICFICFLLGFWSSVGTLRLHTISFTLHKNSAILLNYIIIVKKIPDGNKLLNF